MDHPPRRSDRPDAARLLGHGHEHGARTRLEDLDAALAFRGRPRLARTVEGLRFVRAITRTRAARSAPGSGPHREDIADLVGDAGPGVVAIEAAGEELVVGGLGVADVGLHGEAHGF